MLDVQQRRHLLNLIAQAAGELRMKRIVCETNHGDFMVDIKDTDIGHSLLAEGEYGYREMLRFFDYVHLDPQKHGFVDIGANIGTTSIPLALDGRFTTIAAFEPDPNNFHMLDYNVKINNLGNVIKPFNLALGSRQGEVEFELSADNFGDHRVRYKDPGAGSYNEAMRRRISVTCTTLDTMVENSSIDISNVALIKSDTQGSEGHVLKGAHNVLARRAIPWVIEFWPYGLDRSGIPREEIAAIVKGNFSTFVELKEDGTAKQNMVEHFPELFARYDGVRWCNLVLLP
jgi:FkbM family methyltransferase